MLRNVVGAGAITAIGGSPITQRARTSPKPQSPLMIPDYTKRARLRLATIRGSETRGDS